MSDKRTTTTIDQLSDFDLNDPQQAAEGEKLFEATKDKTSWAEILEAMINLTELTPYHYFDFLALTGRDDEEKRVRDLMTAAIRPQTLQPLPKLSQS